MKNRNKYIKLLRICVVELKRLEGIFKKLPPNDGEELKMIQNHEIIEIQYFQSKSSKRKRSQKKAEEIYNSNRI